MTLMLGACAMPGTSGMSSFMSAMHPTQDFCASHGLTLDATTKQCVTPPAQAAAPQAGPQSAPQAAQAQPAPATTGALAQQPAQPPQVAQAQPATPAVPAGPVQPPAQLHQRAVASIPSEPDAAIDPRLHQDADQIDELAHFVRASGYRCDSISALAPLPTSRGFKLACNHSAYKYAIEDKGARWLVTVQ
jgi:hypothetical protein